MESELQEMVLESMSDGVVVTDRENRILLVNKSAQRMLPFSAGDLAERVLWESIARPGDRRLLPPLPFRAGQGDRPRVHPDRGLRAHPGADRHAAGAPGRDPGQRDPHRGRHGEAGQGGPPAPGREPGRPDHPDRRRGPRDQEPPGLHRHPHRAHPQGHRRPADGFLGQGLREPGGHQGGGGAPQPDRGGLPVRGPPDEHRAASWRTPIPWCGSCWSSCASSWSRPASAWSWSCWSPRLSSAWTPST